jgi:L-seryl-tRNA(Ser) seleniumtransferase
MSQLKTKRRTFLRTVAGVPGLQLLAPSGEAVAGESSSARDVIQELGVRSFINAAGTFTALTGSLLRPEAMAAMQVASRKYVKLEELQDAVGKRIAELLSCPAALVSAGCASALSLATAACVAGKDRRKIQLLPDTTDMKNEVLVQRTHRVGYDHAIRNAGVRMIEVGTREELEKAINERTAMMFFLNSSDPRGKIHHEEFVEIGKKHNIPTLIDAAADVPPVDNLWRFTKMGFDLVGFSGGKGLRGPQSSGLLLGRKDLIEAAKLNDSPNSDSLCRTNKVNKEEIIGMLVALEIYLKQDHAAIWKDWEARCRRIAEAVKEFPDVKTEVYVPRIANAVPHLRVRWDASKRNLTPAQMLQRLHEGTPSIEVGPGSRNPLVIGVWMMEPGDDAIVGERLRAILSGA